MSQRGEDAVIFAKGFRARGRSGRKAHALRLRAWHRALVAPLARAIKAGIVVINIDVALDEQAKKQAGISLAFVGPDNRAGAKLAGDELAKALGKGGKVVIIEGNPGADNAQQRKLGFEDAIKAGKLQLIDSRTAHWETEEANSVFSNILTAHPEIQGVMAANDSMALGVIKAIDAAGKSGKIKVVGFDNTRLCNRC